MLVKFLKKFGYFWTVKGKTKYDRFLVIFGQQRIELNLEKVAFFFLSLLTCFKLKTRSGCP